MNEPKVQSHSGASKPILNFNISKLKPDFGTRNGLTDAKSSNNSLVDHPALCNFEIEKNILGP